MLLICWSVFGFGTKEVLLKTNGILSSTHSACWWLMCDGIRYYNKLCTAVIICKQTLLFRTPISHTTMKNKIRNAFIPYCKCSFYILFSISVPRLDHNNSNNINNGINISSSTIQTNRPLPRSFYITEKVVGIFIFILVVIIYELDLAPTSLAQKFRLLGRIRIVPF